MILQNCIVHTMDHAMPRASALAIAGGRVIGGVDSREDPIASQAHERIDLQGACVVPGFVDAHVHFAGWAASRARADLREASSLDDLFGLVADARQQSGEWLLADGWNEPALRAELNEALDDGSLITRLDAAAEGRPVLLMSKDGHAALVTDTTLERAGIATTTLTAGGRRFDGLVRERDAWQVRQAAPDLDPSVAVMAAAMREAASRGVTCVHDMDGSRGLRLWRELERERGLGMRSMVYLGVDDLPAMEQLGMGFGFGGTRLRIGGIKVFADGTLSAGTAWLRDASPDDCRLTSADELTDIARRAGSARLPLAVHAIGDGAADAVLTALEAARDAWSHLPACPRIEHAQLMGDDLVDRCARLGVVASIQPSHLVTDAPTAGAVWHDRLADAFPWRALADAGVPLVLGSDAPIEDLDPLAAFAAAVRPPASHGFASRALRPIEALTAMTRAPWDVSGLGSSYGRLMPGFAADLVVLSGDPLQDDPDTLKVVATMVGGRFTSGRSRL